MFLSEKIIKLKNCGTVITSEMEIFFDIFPGKIIGITGSDGKTTVSTLIYEMLKAQGLDVFLGGNIGKPLLPQIKKMLNIDHSNKKGKQKKSVAIHT